MRLLEWVHQRGSSHTNPILHVLSVPYHPLYVYMNHQTYPVVKERERDVLSGHSAIPVWVFLCTLKCALFKCFHWALAFLPRWWRAVEGKREREREVEEEEVWVVMGRTGYRWKSTEICHMERLRRDRNKAKEASEMIAKRKTAKCWCILIETEPYDDVDRVEVKIC